MPIEPVPPATAFEPIKTFLPLLEGSPTWL